MNRGHHHGNDQDNDLERLISGSLTSRSDAVDGVSGSIADVHRRVDRRRDRRRHTAAFGATAMLAAGAFAMTAIGSPDPTSVPLAPPDSHGGSASAVQEVWRCTEPVGPPDDQGASYFAHCDLTTTGGTAPATSMSLVPTTTVCAVSSGGTATSSVPCPWGPPPTVGAHCSTTSGTAAITVPCATAPVQEITHQVEAGDTLTSISDMYGIPIEEIVSLNQWGGRGDVTLVEGDTIVIALTPTGPTSTAPTDPVPTTTSIAITTTTTSGVVLGEQVYVIEAGDSLASIAAAFGVTLEQLVNYNEFEAGAEHLILPDDRLLVPPGALTQP